MRASRRLYAAVTTAASKYLEPNVPTGLTGLVTHPSPRPALLYTYNLTLEKLKQLPPSSVYRQSTEALTKHRMSILEQFKPPGHAEWLARVQKVIDADPEAYSKYRRADGSILAVDELDENKSETWDGEVTRRDAINNINVSEGEAQRKAQRVKEEIEKVDREAEKGTMADLKTLENEPQLTAEQ